MKFQLTASSTSDDHNTEPSEIMQLEKSLMNAMRNFRKVQLIPVCSSRKEGIDNVKHSVKHV